MTIQFTARKVPPLLTLKALLSLAFLVLGVLPLTIFGVTNTPLAARWLYVWPIAIGAAVVLWFLLVCQAFSIIIRRIWNRPASRLTGDADLMHSRFRLVEISAAILSPIFLFISFVIVGISGTPGGVLLLIPAFTFPILVSSVVVIVHYYWFAADKIQTEGNKQAN